MPVLSDASLQQLFSEARTFNAFTAQPVSDEVLARLYELVKLGPTSTNSHPTRFVFVRTPEGKQRLAPALAPGNLEKTMGAPVTVVVAYDDRYHEKMGKLMPMRPELGERLAAMPVSVLC